MRNRHLALPFVLVLVLVACGDNIADTGDADAADHATTTLVELTADGGPRPALVAPGFLHGVARIR
jgi:hypothetical protein